MIAFLVDADNLCAPAWVEEAFRQIEANEGVVDVRRAYGSAEKLKGLAEVLRFRVVRSFVNLSMSKNTTDVALAVDAMELACQLPRLTTMVIGSGDADFLPLVMRLRERGIRMLCVSEAGKLAAEAAAAYHQVFLVAGEEISTEAPALAAPAPPKKSGAKKAPAKSVPGKKAPAKKVSAKKSSPLKNPPPPAVPHASGAIELNQILQAVPRLGDGQPLQLSEVVKLLRDAKLLSKNATSTKLFKKFTKHFELTPEKQPNQVRYILPQAT